MSNDQEAGQPLHPSAQRVFDWAASNGLQIDVHEYEKDGARTAEDAANAVGCKVDQIVKSMIFSLSSSGSDGGGDTAGDGEAASTELVLALTAGSNKIDPKKLAEVAGGGRCGRADPEEVRAITGYAIGGVPPFGHANQIRTWIDPHLLNFDQIWGAAGTPRHVFPIAPTRLVELTGAIEARFTA